MCGLLQLGFVVLSFVKWARLGRVVAPEEARRLAALRASTGFAVLAAMILIALAAYYQQPWYKMKSWGEIAKAEEEAATRGVKLTEDEAREAARNKLLTFQSRAKLGLYAAVLTTLLLIGQSKIVARFAPIRPMKTFAIASVGILALAVGVYLFLLQPWGSWRKSIEAREIIRAQWVNDPPPPPEALRDAVASREFKEKRGAVAFPVAAFIIVAAAIGGGSLWNLNAISSGRGLRVALILAAVGGVLSMVFRLPGSSGVSGTSSNQQAYFHLQSILRAEAEYRERDLDGNKIADWWVADVSGLSRLLVGNDPIGRLGGTYVQMDGAPLERGSGRIRLEPFARDANIIYPLRVRVIPKAADGTPYAQDLDGDGNAFESTRGFAFCCYPWKYGEYGGEETLIVDQTGGIWRKNLGGAAVEQWPADPEKEGWIRWVEGRRRPERYILAGDDE